MSEEFYRIVHELAREGKPFALATVVQSEGSASARTGAKAIVHGDGRVQFGWVGGGCVDALVAREAQDSLRDGRPRLLEIDLQDEVSGAGMPCGGRMRVYVEPVLARPTLQIIGHGAIAEAVARIGHVVGFRIAVNGPGATAERFPQAEEVVAEDPRLEKLALTPSTFVVVTTQHKADDVALKRALASGTRYVALVASRKRAEIVLGYLKEDGVPADRLAAVRAPCGLDLSCVTPEEIALAIVAEIVAVHRGGSGRPLNEVKGAPVPRGATAPASPCARGC